MARREEKCNMLLMFKMLSLNSINVCRSVYAGVLLAQVQDAEFK